MSFISSSRFISGYLIGAGIMWGFMIFDYGPKKDKIINKLKEEVEIYKKAFNVSVLILEEKEQELEKERRRVCKIQEEKREDFPVYILPIPQTPDVRRSESSSESYKRNRFRGIAGYGPNGLEISSGSISINRGIVGGIGYDRLLWGPMSIGAEVFTNGQINGTMGIDF